MANKFYTYTIRHTQYGLRIAYCVLLLALLTAAPARAQSPTPAPVDPATIPDDAVNAIAKEMFCPVCENTPLDVCPTQACHQWRELIRQRLAEGWTEEEIKAYFVQQYGDRVLAEPPLEGFNWLVYLIPPLAFLAGAAFVFRLLRSWKTAAPVPAVDTPTLDNEYVQRLEEELRKRG